MAIEVSELVIRRSRRTILDRVSLRVERGSVSAFVGPNGAGKSTTIKAMAGLMKPNSGTVTYDGAALGTQVQPAGVVGFSMDNFGYHPGRTVRETLTLHALATGMPKRRLDEVLRETGLESVAAVPLRKTSLGMRQRLSMGCAILPWPNYLVLDEPFNGLDMNGMRWMRNLISEFSRDGGGVLLSSHALSELQSISDHVVMISQGSIVRSGPLESIAQDIRTLIRGENMSLLEQMLNHAQLNYEVDARGLWVDADAATISRLAVESRLILTHLDQGSYDLETAYDRATEGRVVAEEGAA